jgi:hypothetical protein
MGLTQHAPLKENADEKHGGNTEKDKTQSAITSRLGFLKGR